MSHEKKTIAIGIDPGTKTGVAVYDKRAFSLTLVKTMKIHEAMEFVKNQSFIYDDELLVRFEDARQRKWFGKGTRAEINAKKQGAGSVKRDCSIWEDFLNGLNIEFHMVAPGRASTKINANYFKQITGCTERTSEHARDAAMLVYKVI